MDGKDYNLKEGGGGGDCFVDRSRVRILLCDNDAKSSEEVFYLLLKCSYQVTSVRSPRQVIDALNAEGHEIDIILVELDLPMKKGLKLLKYITRDKNLHRIPVIMMSAKDEVSTVVKCLRLGAADYLVKPLRTNELLNLWTHMWRRRRMLGLAEKNLLHYDFDLVVSDPSDINTNSTNLLSDDTDEKPRKNTNLELGMSINQESESIAVKEIESRPPMWQPLDCQVDSPETDDYRGQGAEQVTSVPKKSELKIGESSAFLSYVKSTTGRKSSLEDSQVEDGSVRTVRMEQRSRTCNDSQVLQNGEIWENVNRNACAPTQHAVSRDRSRTPPVPKDFGHSTFKEDGLPHVPVHPILNGDHAEGSGMSMQNVYPYYMSGVMNQVMVPPGQVYHGHSSMLPQYNHLSSCSSHMGVMPSFPYYPLNLCLQHGNNQPWQPLAATSSDTKQNKLDRREAALMKFRQKRKERCFDKKIRYVNRKKLAERRPRIRGQFVRKMNDMDVDLNGQPASTDCDDEEEEDYYEDMVSRDSSPENDPSVS